MNNESICKTYIKHQDQWYFVSTIERDSSAPVNPAPRYLETIVWEYEYETGRRGKLLGIFNSENRRLDMHEFLVAELFKTGKVQIEEGA